MCELESGCPRTEFKDGGCTVHYTGERKCISCGTTIVDTAEQCETLRCGDCYDEWEERRALEATAKGLDGLGNRQVPR